MRFRPLALSILMLSAASIITGCQTPPPDAIQPSASMGEAGRVETLLSDGWQFTVQGQEGSAPDAAPPADWSGVSVPHTWNRVGYYKVGRTKGSNTPDSVNKTMGIGWYYRALDIKPTTGRRVFLEFDAASRTAEVWLNGQKIGGHRNPFGRFRVDATDALHTEGPNHLYVKVDNSAPELGSSTDDVFPLRGDFFVRGGLYRPVSVIVTDDVHIDLLDHGGPGVYADTLSIDGDAKVRVRSRLANGSGDARGVQVTASLLNADGQSVAEAQQMASLSADTTSDITQNLSVPSPRLWNGTKDPYLYTLRVEVRSADGTLLDRLDQKYGIRTMDLDPQRGLLLNGQPYRLLGVGLHQDSERADWAMSDADIAETMDIIRDMGANSIRLTHYQHGSPIHDLADQYGIVLWDEIAVVTAWTTADDQLESPIELRDNARLQTKDMIRQNYNHASVAVWGIANEVDFGPGRPDFLGKPPADVPDPKPLLENLYQLAKAEDATRPIVLADCCALRGMKDVPNVAQTVDAVGANRYFGWYYGDPSQLGAHLDDLLASHPDKPLSISEYGAGSAHTQQSDHPLGGPIDMAGVVQPELYASWFHEESWKQLKDRDYLWGTYIWNAFDFGSTVRTEGDAQDINTKGLVSYDRKVKKDAFYFYRANWSDAPTVHVTGRRYIDRAYPVTEVRVYSNAPVTRLTLNGTVVGELRDCPDRVCVWPNVRLTAGENSVSASGLFEGEAMTDSIAWRLDADQADSYRIDTGTVIAGTAARQFGSDAFFIGGAAGTADTRGGRGRKPVFVTIAGTDIRDIAATYRFGTFSYRLPVQGGRYRVTLTFVAPDRDEGLGPFDVVLNGTTMLGGFDVLKQAGGPLKAMTQSKDVTVTGGEILLEFKPRSGKAIVSAIEVERL